MFDQIATNTVIDDIALRILLSITTGIFWLVIILVIIRLFKIRNPNVRYFLLTIPLLKSLLALARNLPYFRDFQGIFVVNAQLPDMGMFLPSLKWQFADALYGNYFHPTISVSPITILIIIGSSLAFTVWRMTGMFRFVRLINTTRELERHKYKTVFEILDKLVAKTKITYPKVILLNSSGTPFTFGLRKPVIAFSAKMIDQLEPAEIEAVLTHEVAHITRRDHVYHWLNVILRDILFFNPVTHYLFPRLSFERERACDHLASIKTRPLILAKSLVKVAEIQASEPVLPIIRRYAPQSLIPQNHSHFKKRVKELLEPKGIYVLPGHFKKAFLLAFILVLVTLDVHLVTKLENYILVLS